MQINALLFAVRPRVRLGRVGAFTQRSTPDARSRWMALVFFDAASITRQVMPRTRDEFREVLVGVPVGDRLSEGDSPADQRSSIESGIHGIA